jgi:predicted O-methyltransferase YrrM
MSIRYCDKVLPTQPYFSRLFEGGGYSLAIARSVMEFSAGRSPDQFRLKTPAHVGFEEMSSTPAALSLLVFLIKATGAKSILEIGTFIGHTTMHLVKAAGEDARIVTIECGSEFAHLAEQNFSANGLSDRITLMEGEGRSVLASLAMLPHKFDLIFLDGGKQDYLVAAQTCEALLSESGMLVVDDVFFHGDALNKEPTTAKGVGCRDLLNHYQGRSDIGTLLLPIGNGLLIVYRAAAGVEDHPLPAQHLARVLGFSHA